MKLSKTMKKTVAYVCAIAMIVTSMAGYQRQAEAATFSITDGAGVTYTVANETGNYAGFVFQGAFNDAYFGFAWDASLGSPKATVTVQKDEATVLELGSKAGGEGIYTTAFAELEDGSYKLVFTGEGEYTDQVETLDLTISGKGDAVITTTEAPTPDADGWYTAELDKDPWINLGVWEYYFGSWRGVTASYQGGDAVDGFKLRINSSGLGDYCAQARAKGFATEAGKNYKVTIKVNSDKAEGIIKSSIDQITPLEEQALVEGENVIVKNFKATSASADIYFNLDAIVAGTALDFTSVTFEETAELQTTTKAPSPDYSGLFTSDANILKNAAISATTTDPVEAGGNGIVSVPENLVDANLGTYWASYFTIDWREPVCPEEYKDNDTVIVDLGAPVDASTLKKLAIAWRTGETVPASVKVSAAETAESEYTEIITIAPTWNDIANGDGDTERNITAYDIEAAGNVQFVKFEMTGPKLYGYQIAEIAVLTDSELPSVPDPTDPSESESESEDVQLPEITFQAPVFTIDTGADFRKLEMQWNAVEGENIVYTAYIGDRNTIAKTIGGYVFENVGFTHIDTIKAVPGTDMTVIVDAKDNTTGKVVATGTKVVSVPNLTAKEAAMAALMGKIQSEDNIAAGKEVIVASKENEKANLTDKNLGSRWQADKTVSEDQSFAVNFGEEKDVSGLIIQWENSCANAFDIYVAGADGEYGDTPVASGTAEGLNPITILNFDKVSAQYVKVVPTALSENAATYGVSAFEIAIFSETVEMPAIDPINPTGLVASQVEGELKISVNWTDAPEAAGLAQTYNVYVGEEKVLTDVAAGTYTIDATEGEYTVKVTAVYEGKESEGTTADVTVVTPPTQPPTEPGETTAPGTSWTDAIRDEDQNMGVYTYYVGSWNGGATAQIKGGNAIDNFSMNVTYSTYQEWLIQVKVFFKTEVGKEYTYSTKLNAQKADGTYGVKIGPDSGGIYTTPLQLAVGENTFVGETKYTAVSDTTAVVFQFGFIGVDNQIDFKEVKLVDEEGNEAEVIVKEEETTTPDAGETTTPDAGETTTEKPTTAAPTTQAPTTVAPTTKAPVKVKAPAKVKISKVTAKKKTSSKAKITLKKIKGVKGYEVRILKSKKAKKSLVKKFVKKARFTIKSKKLKNKKKLYVKVRAYKLDAKGKKVYGEWSKAKRIRIKK